MSTRDTHAFRTRLLERLLTAAGATSTGLMLAAACGGKSRTDADATETGGGGTHAAGSSQGGTAGLSSQGATAGRARGGGAGLASGAGGSSIALAGAGGTLQIEPPDAGQSEPMRICIVFSELGSAVTSGTGGSPPCNSPGGMGGSAGLGGRGGAGTPTAGAAGASGELGQAGGGEGGEASVSCPDPASVPELDGYPCSLGCRLRSDGWEPLSNVGVPTVVDGACCYDLLVRKTECIYVGRAFLVDDGLVRSSVRQGAGWQFGALPDVRELSPRTRAALAEAWLKDAAFEHASVATFARFALQLLSVGAPSELLHKTMAAGNDEIRHAELCFTLASAYAGKPLEPDSFPIGDTLAIQRDLVDIVAETIVEGCIGETLAAMQAQAQLDITTDPAVLESLLATVEDETRHAELAWEVVAWAVSAGSPAVRRIAERAFAEFEAPKPPQIELGGLDLDAFAAHGRLTPEHAREVALETLALVVRPCAAALLERDVMPHLAQRATAQRASA